MTGVIDGETYAVDEWVIAQNGRILEEEWTDGFIGGMGEWERRSPNSYYILKNMDASTFPFLRLRPRSEADVATANLTPASPVYVFSAQDGSGNNYIYLLNDRRAFKFDADDGSYTLESTKDFGAGAVCGRPVVFNGNWYVPLGESVDYVKLVTIAVGASADTWTATAAGQKARHFATKIQDSVAQLARAEADSKVAFTSTPDIAVSWGPSPGLSVTESSLPINDLLVWRGEYVAITAAWAHRFDQDGNAFPMQEFVGKNLQPGDTFDGANSLSHGQYFYWSSSSTGFWRFRGMNAEPVGPDAGLDWYDAELENFQSFPDTKPQNRRTSAAAWGRWIYVSFKRHVYYGFIRDDGSILWHGRLFQGTSGTLRLGIVGGGETIPLLVLADQTGPTVRFIRLMADGSMRTSVGSIGGDTQKRGAASEPAQAWFPNLDFGDARVKKQMRLMWVEVAGMTTNAPVQFAHHRDTGNGMQNASTDLGATITSNGFHERLWTPGSADLCYRIVPTIKITPNGSYNPAIADPRIRAFGIVAATPSLYRITILCTQKELRSGQTVDDVMQTFRDMLNAGAKTFKEPEERGPADSWPGYVVGYTEQPLEAEDGDEGIGGGYRVTLTVQRFEYGS